MDWTLPYPSRRQPICAATSSRRRSRSPRRRASRCSRAAATPSMPRSRRRSRSPSSSRAATASARDLFAILWDGDSARRPERIGPRAGRVVARSVSPALSQMPQRGWETVTIPGAVSGWVALSQRYGKLPFDDLFERAIRYARDGYRGVAGRRRQMALAGAADAARTRLAGAFPDRRPRAGCRRALRVARDGRDARARSRATRGEAFYRGALADAMVAACECARRRARARRLRAPHARLGDADRASTIATSPCTRFRRTARASPR